MKKSIIISAAVAISAALFSVNANGQDSASAKKDMPYKWGELGVRFMPTFTSLTFNNPSGDVVTGQATLSYGYGGMLARNFSKNVGMQVEVNYNAISQKYKDQGLERQISVNYLDIPLLLSLNTDVSKPVNFNLVVGPQFGLNIGSKISANGNSETDTVNATVGAKGSDVGLAYGAGLGFMLNKPQTLRFDVGFRGAYGLVDLKGSNSNTSPDTYNINVRASRKSYGGYAGLTLLF
jgi:hypothetical protein